MKGRFALTAAVSMNTFFFRRLNSGETKSRRRPLQKSSQLLCFSPLPILCDRFFRGFIFQSDRLEKRGGHCMRFVPGMFFLFIDSAAFFGVSINLLFDAF